MLKLLLDEHISPDVANGLRRRNRAIVVRYMVEWEEGHFLGQEDSLCLREAAAQGLTLVTYDRRTIPPLLKAWAEEERTHGGVVFVDERTISPADSWTSLSTALRRRYRRFGLGLDQTCWRNRELGLDRQSLFPAAVKRKPSSCH